MAMLFRESNQVKWVGIRPAHNGTQVLENSYSENDTAIVYTVPASKVFFLCTAIVSIRVIAAGILTLIIYDAVPAVVFYIFNDGVIAAQAGNSHNVSFWPPIELAAGYTVKIMTSGVGLAVRAGVHGWIEDI